MASSGETSMQGKVRIHENAKLTFDKQQQTLFVDQLFSNFPQFLLYITYENSDGKWVFKQGTELNREFTQLNTTKSKAQLTVFIVDVKFDTYVYQQVREWGRLTCQGIIPPAPNLYIFLLCNFQIFL